MHRLEFAPSDHIQTSPEAGVHSSDMVIRSYMYMLCNVCRSAATCFHSIFTHITFLLKASSSYRNCGVPITKI